MGGSTERFVIDASVAVAWHLEDEVSVYADRVLDRLETGTAIVPSLWLYEVTNVFLSAERRGRLDPIKVTRALSLLQDLRKVIATQELDEVFTSVFDLAKEQGLTVYDASYLYLAMREGLPLATLDTELRNAAQRVGVTLLD